MPRLRSGPYLNQRMRCVLRAMLVTTTAVLITWQATGASQSSTQDFDQYLKTSVAARLILAKGGGGHGNGHSGSRAHDGGASVNRNAGARNRKAPREPYDGNDADQCDSPGLHGLEPETCP